MAESTAPGSSQNDAPEPTWPKVDRRSQSDRRDRPTQSWDSLLGRRRRKLGRRDGESEERYVDRFGRREIGLVLAIFVLNIFDAFCTLAWLERGGSEGNPLMDWALQSGDSVFLFQKCVVAGIWLLILLVHKNFRIARVGLWSLLAVYSALALYHVFLVLFAEPIPVLPNNY